MLRKQRFISLLLSVILVASCFSTDSFGGTTHSTRGQATIGTSTAPTGSSEKQDGSGSRAVLIRNEQKVGYLISIDSVPDVKEFNIDEISKKLLSKVTTAKYPLYSKTDSAYLLIIPYLNQNTDSIFWGLSSSMNSVNKSTEETVYINKTAIKVPVVYFDISNSVLAEARSLFMRAPGDHAKDVTSEMRAYFNTFSTKSEKDKEMFIISSLINSNWIAKNPTTPGLDSFYQAIQDYLVKKNPKFTAAINNSKSMPLVKSNIAIQPHVYLRESKYTYSGKASIVSEGQSVDRVLDWKLLSDIDNNNVISFSTTGSKFKIDSQDAFKFLYGGKSFYANRELYTEPTPALSPSAKKIDYYLTEIDNKTDKIKEYYRTSFAQVDFKRTPSKMYSAESFNDNTNYGSVFRLQNKLGWAYLRNDYFLKDSGTVATTIEGRQNNINFFFSENPFGNLVKNRLGVSINTSFAPAVCTIYNDGATSHMITRPGEKVLPIKLNVNPNRITTNILGPAVISKVFDYEAKLKNDKASSWPSSFVNELDNLKKITFADLLKDPYIAGANQVINDKGKALSTQKTITTDDKKVKQEILLDISELVKSADNLFSKNPTDANNTGYLRIYYQPKIVTSQAEYSGKKQVSGDIVTEISNKFNQSAYIPLTKSDLVKAVSFSDYSIYEAPSDKYHFKKNSGTASLNKHTAIQFITEQPYDGLNNILPPEERDDAYGVLEGTATKSDASSYVSTPINSNAKTDQHLDEQSRDGKIDQPAIYIEVPVKLQDLKAYNKDKKVLMSVTAYVDVGYLTSAQASSYLKQELSKPAIFKNQKFLTSGAVGFRGIAYGRFISPLNPNAPGNNSKDVQRTLQLHFNNIDLKGSYSTDNETAEFYVGDLRGGYSLKGKRGYRSLDTIVRAIELNMPDSPPTTTLDISNFPRKLFVEPLETPIGEVKSQSYNVLSGMPNDAELYTAVGYDVIGSKGTQAYNTKEGGGYYLTINMPFSMSYLYEDTNSGSSGSDGGCKYQPTSGTQSSAEASAKSGSLNLSVYGKSYPKIISSTSSYHSGRTIDCGCKVPIYGTKEVNDKWVPGYYDSVKKKHVPGYWTKKKVEDKSKIVGCAVRDTYYLSGYTTWHASAYRILSGSVSTTRTVRYPVPKYLYNLLDTMKLTTITLPVIDVSKFTERTERKPAFDKWTNEADLKYFNVPGFSDFNLYSSQYATSKSNKEVSVSTTGSLSGTSLNWAVHSGVTLKSTYGQYNTYDAGLPTNNSAPASSGSAQSMATSKLDLIADDVYPQIVDQFTIAYDMISNVTALSVGNNVVQVFPTQKFTQRVELTPADKDGKNIVIKSTVTNSMSKSNPGKTDIVFTIPNIQNQVFEELDPFITFKSGEPLGLLDNVGSRGNHLNTLASAYLSSDKFNKISLALAGINNGSNRLYNDSVVSSAFGFDPRVDTNAAVPNSFLETSIRESQVYDDGLFLDDKDIGRARNFQYNAETLNQNGLLDTGHIYTNYAHGGFEKSGNSFYASSISAINASSAFNRAAFKVPIPLTKNPVQTAKPAYKSIISKIVNDMQARFMSGDQSKLIVPKEMKDITGSNTEKPMSISANPDVRDINADIEDGNTVSYSSSYTTRYETVKIENVHSTHTGDYTHKINDIFIDTPIALQATDIFSGSPVIERYIKGDFRPEISVEGVITSRVALNKDTVKENPNVSTVNLSKPAIFRMQAIKDNNYNATFNLKTAVNAHTVGGNPAMGDPLAGNNAKYIRSILVSLPYDVIYPISASGQPLPESIHYNAGDMIFVNGWIDNTNGDRYKNNIDMIFQIMPTSEEIGVKEKEFANIYIFATNSANMLDGYILHKNKNLLNKIPGLKADVVAEKGSNKHIVLYDLLKKKEEQTILSDPYDVDTSISSRSTKLQIQKQTYLVGSIGNLAMTDSTDANFKTFFKASSKEKSLYGVHKVFPFWQANVAHSTVPLLSISPADSLNSYRTTYEMSYPNRSLASYRQLLNPFDGGVKKDNANALYRLPLSSVHSSTGLDLPKVGHKFFLDFETVGDYVFAEVAPVHKLITYDAKGNIISTEDVDIYQKDEKTLNYIKIYDGIAIDRAEKGLADSSEMSWVSKSPEIYRTVTELDLVRRGINYKRYNRFRLSTNAFESSVQFEGDYNKKLSTTISGTLDSTSFGNAYKYHLGDGLYNYIGDIYVKDPNPRGFKYQDFTSQVAAEYMTPGSSVVPHRVTMSAKRWYFDMSLPNGAVVVPSGTPIKDILNVAERLKSERSILVTYISVKAAGTKYNLSLFEAGPVTYVDVKVPNIPTTIKIPKCIGDKCSVIIYDNPNASQARDDVNSKGTH